MYVSEVIHNEPLPSFTHNFQHIFGFYLLGIRTFVTPHEYNALYDLLKLCIHSEKANQKDVTRKNMLNFRVISIGQRSYTTKQNR